MNILSVILIIGILVFVHELGHFLAAKSLKIPVKIFSIGFPLGNLRPLIKFNWNETECQLNALPLGGFCAFMDDERAEDGGERDPNDQRFLNNRKVWERFVVISGGVVFNFIFAVIIAIAMYFTMGIPEGREFSDGVTVLEVKAGSPAEKAGLQSFDTIIQVDQTPLKFNSDMKTLFENSLKIDPDKKTAKVSFLSSEGTKKTSEITLNSDGKFNIESSDVSGIFINKIIAGGPAEKAGLKQNDIIIDVAGKDIKGSRNPEGLLKEALKAQTENTPVSVKVLRNGEEQNVSVTLNSEKKLGVGIEFIKGIFVKSSENEKDLPKNSLVTEVNNNSLYDTSSLMKTLISKHKDGTVATVVIKRGEEEKTIEVTPLKEGIIGVQIQPALKEIRREANSFLEPFIMAGEFIISTTILLSAALLSLFSGHVSASEIGGPIMVVAKGAEIAQADFSKLFQFTIMISIELVILNVIPLPAVDGGHLFLLIIEKIRGRKLPRAIEEKIHYTGLLLLLGLGVFLILKDVLTLSKIIR